MIPQKPSKNSSVAKSEFDFTKIAQNNMNLFNREQYRVYHDKSASSSSDEEEKIFVEKD